MASEKVDITDHVLIPEHEVLSDDDKIKLLEELNINEIQLPSIKEKDPIVAQLEAKVGSVIKITRKLSVESGSVYYRRVV
jgi:DNA-directed RNA polymerase subunit H